MNVKLTGSAAEAALEMVSSQNGKIITITPLEGVGETIWYVLPNGNYCTISTNDIPSYSGVGGDNNHEAFILAFAEHVEALVSKGVEIVNPLIQPAA